MTVRTSAAILALSAVLAGCSYDTAKVPPAPVAPVPTPDPPTLIFPQTALELPDPQPVPPEAIPKRDQPVQPTVAETPAVRTPPHRTPTTSTTSATGTKREPEASESASTAPGPQPAQTSGRTPLVPVGPGLPNSDMIQKRLDALKSVEPRLSSKTGRDAEMTRNRIQFFIDQATKALARKDLRQADSLASRAEVLAEDLLSVR